MFGIGRMKLLVQIPQGGSQVLQGGLRRHHNVPARGPEFKSDPIVGPSTAQLPLSTTHKRDTPKSISRCFRTFRFSGYLHKVVGGLGFGQHPRFGIQQGDGRRSESQEPIRLPKKKKKKKMIFSTHKRKQFQRAGQLVAGPYESAMKALAAKVVL